jgi:hypothetical protein
MNKFYVDECPSDIMMMNYIKANSDWNDAVASVKNDFKDTSYVFKWLGESFEQSIRESLLIWGFHGWRTYKKDCDYYGGYSLVYNPEHINSHNPLNSTLGEYDNSPKEYVEIVDRNIYLKNSYFDSLGFNERTDPAKYGVLGDLMDEIEGNGFTLIRGRLAVIMGQIYDYELHKSRGWHIDEPVFENLRLNIPCYGNTADYSFELKGRPSQELKLGNLYTWDTNILHRAYTIKRSDDSRANLVVGVSPWLKYNKKERYWEFNEFYGKEHPFSMLINGKITSHVKFLESF